MSTHTLTFCDICNEDRSSDQTGDDGHAMYPDDPFGAVYEGWATFEKPARYGTTDTHVCAHCLADPEYALEEGYWDDYGTPNEYGASAENVEKGRAHAQMYADARASIGGPDHWRVVRQTFGSQYRNGPRPWDLEDALYTHYREQGLDPWTGEPRKALA